MTFGNHAHSDMNPKQSYAMRGNQPCAAAPWPSAAPRNLSIARFQKTLIILLTLVFSILSPAIAKGPKGGNGKAFQKIVDVNAVSVSVSVGAGGNTHLKYLITDATKVTVNGAPANARDLRSGMVADIEVSSDGKTAVTITAKDPPAHPARHRVG
jgi:hypothetical protein